MTDKPILFSGPMVRAILDGRKTVTRRVLKPQPPEWATFCQELQGLYVSRGWAPSGLWQWSEPEQNPPRKLRRWPAHVKGPMAGIDYGMKPLHAPGDRLWVREAWRTDSGLDHLSGKGIEQACLEAGYKAPWAPIAYGDGTVVNWQKEHGLGRYRHARFMPRWASRITLEVTGVKVERLQDISEEEAAAEGPSCHVCGGGFPSEDDCHCFHRDKPARIDFHALWDSINGKREGASWDDNPWVAAISFRRVTP